MGRNSAEGLIIYQILSPKPNAICAIINTCLATFLLYLLILTFACPVAIGYVEGLGLEYTLDE